MRECRFTEELETEAIKQATEGEHKVVDVAQRLSVSDKSLYLWTQQSSGKKSRSEQTVMVYTFKAINSFLKKWKILFSRFNISFEERK